MAPSTPPETRTLWIVIAAACLFFGSVIGYVIGSMSGQGGAAVQAPASSPAATGAPPPSAPSTPQPAIVNEQQVQAYRSILARDPKNAQAATQLANLMYDAGRYDEALPFYRQALALDPRNISVSTDLGTSLWYTGRPDEALAQFQRSLDLDGSHAQTLFNVGIVRLNGKQDPKGAIEAWERLLAAHPSYADRANVQDLIAQARQGLAAGGK